MLVNSEGWEKRTRATEGLGWVVTRESVSSFFFSIKSSRVRDRFQARPDPQNADFQEIGRTKKPFTNPLVQVVLVRIYFFFLGILIDLFRVISFVAAPRRTHELFPFLL